jgi:hypothetical protein
MRVRLLTALAFTGLGACVTVPNVGSVSPTQMHLSAGKGMVFAEVHILGVFTDGMIAMYAGGHNKGAVNDDAYSVELPPGEYTLDSFTRVSSGGSGGFKGVSVTLTDYTSWEVHRTFTVRAGEVTNLGEIVVLPQATGASGQGQLKYTFVDNSSDAPYLFKARFPQLAASLPQDAMRLAPGDYVRGEELTRLRSYIASTLSQKMPQQRYIAGPAGTLAVVGFDKRKNARVFSLVDTGTTAGLVAGGEDRHYDRFSYRTSDGRVFVLRSGRPQMRSRPEGVDFHYPVYVAGENTAIVATSSFEVFESTDDAVSWNRVVDRQEKDQAWYHRDFGFAHDDKAMFVFRKYPARVVTAALESRQFEVLDIPADVKEIRGLTVLKSEMVLQPMITAWSEKTLNPFYVRARWGGEWQLRHLPLGTCGAISFLDESGARLRTTCGRSTYASNDGGEHWDVVSPG